MSKYDCTPNKLGLREPRGTESETAEILSHPAWPFPIKGIQRQPDRKRAELANGVPDFFFSFWRQQKVQKEEEIEVVGF